MRRVSVADARRCHRSLKPLRRHSPCVPGGSIARKLEELPIYPRVMQFWTAVNALLARPVLRRNSNLHKQIEEANDSITSNMHEGFEQGTDKAFANYLTYSKASLAEVLGRLRAAHGKRHISSEELNALTGAGEELGKMLGGFIKYLRKCDWKDRGRFQPPPMKADEE
jgi:four helix bundle protein